MSTKKRFTISPDLASGIRTTIESASINQGQLHYDVMSIDVIEPDPNNPRKLLISRAEIIHGLNPSDQNYGVKVKELDALNELAESIKRIGVRNAIEVYKDGLHYRIITGERRYLAAIIAGQKTIPVRVNQKLDEFNLRYTQWIENINRQDLSLLEKFNNLMSIADAYKKTNNQDFDVHILQNLLAVSNVQAYRYFCLLKADEKIIQLIQLGKLNNLKLIQELVTIKDKVAYNQIVSWIMASKAEVTSLAKYKNVAGKKTTKTNSGQSINLGKINDKYLAKQLFEVVLSNSKLHKYHENFNNIDWSSPKEIHKAFKTLLKTFEKEFRREEIANEY